MAQIIHKMQSEMAAFFFVFDIYIKTLNAIESKIKNIKGRTSYLNQRPRRTKSTCASSPFDRAKVVRNTETAKRNLEKLAEKYRA